MPKGKYNRRLNKNIREFNGIKERKCSKCKEWLPETTEYYYMHNKSKPEKGFQAACKKCSIKDVQKRYPTIPVEIRQEKRREYHILNYDIENQNARNWRERNPERKQEYQLDYQRNNPDKMKTYSKNRQHKNHKITKNEWQACLKYFNYSCAYCDLKAEDHYNIYAGKLRKESLNKEHFDHEGNNGLSNCVPACKSCNDKKWKHSFDYWYNKNNPVFSQERYNKIVKWIMEDCFQYIEKNK